MTPQNCEKYKQSNPDAECDCKTCKKNIETLKEMWTPQDKASEIFEGKNSSLRRTFDKATQPYNQRDHSHCWEKENPPCGIKGKHRCCLCELPVPTHHDWEERFRNIGEGSVRFIATRQEVKDFIRQELDQARLEERQKVVEMLEMVDSNKWKDAKHCTCLGYALNFLKNNHEGEHCENPDCTVC